VKAFAPMRTPSTQPSQRVKSAAKTTKSETPVVSSTPARAPTLRHHEPAEHRKADERQAGLNYLVVKNLKTRASAEKAREALLRNGFATTVERKLPGQSGEGNYCLVSLSGFDPLSERAELDKRVKQLKALKLDPKPYTWRG
jgi:hypothetical protein